MAGDDDLLLELFADRVATEQGDSSSLFQNNAKSKLKTMLVNDIATLPKGSQGSVMHLVLLLGSSRRMATSVEHACSSVCLRLCERRVDVQSRVG